MKKMDSYGLKLCAFQAELFARSIVSLECSSKIFIRRYLHSDFAARMDTNGFFFESMTFEDAFDELDRQYGATTYGRLRFPAEELHWIGYIYRYWAYTYGWSSKQLFRFIKPEELRDLYFPYHSLDPAQAIERILEAKDVVPYDSLARGVQILRMVREKSTYSAGDADH